MPAPRQLRGIRYAKDCRPEAINMIASVLPYLSFDEAQDAYNSWANKLKMPELALLGCNDRYWLLTALLNRKDAIHPWLYDRAREVEARPDGYLDLWARFHFKSTIITFAGCIQEAMADPEIRIGIFSNTKSISSKFLNQLKNELESNDFLKAIYRDVLWEAPRTEAPSWSVEKGLTVKRKGNPKEATIEAHGVIDAMPTGRHFPLLVFDDVITEKNVTNPDQIKLATERVELADNLGDLDCTRKWFIGTRYSYADTYGQLLKDEVLKPRIYPATFDKTLETYRRGPDGKILKDADGNPVPNLVLLKPERWEDIKKAQRSTIAAQHLQNPLAGQENLFKPEWLLSYYVRPTMMNVYIMADPSLGIHRSSDRTAIAVVGIDAVSNKYLLDGYCHRMSLSERWIALRDLQRKWSGMQGVQTVQVGYERYGMQSDLEYFEERMRIESRQAQRLGEATIHFTIEELAWTRNRGQESKAHRVGRLEPDFRQSSFFVPALVWYPGAPMPPKMAEGIAAGRMEAPKDPSTALWSVTEDGKIAYRARVLPHEQETAVARDGALWRLIKPLRRKDEDNNIYDLTRVFFEEYLFFPFSPRDDLVDAMSRIYDMQPLAAQEIETVEPENYPD